MKHATRRTRLEPARTLPLPCCVLGHPLLRSPAECVGLERPVLQVDSYELRYAGPYVQNHRLYVPKDEREGWHAKRTAREWSRWEQ